MEKLTEKSTGLTKTIRQTIAEAIGLDRNIFESLFEEDQQDRMRLIKYPEPDCSAYDDSENPSLGSHQDTTFGALIYQIGDHECLQTLSPSGEWIYCPPLPGTVVYVLGQSFNAYTYGFCHAAWHRVIPPSPGKGSRYSMVLASFIGPHTAVKFPKTKERLDHTKGEIVRSQPGHKPIVPLYLVEESKFASAGQRVFTPYVKSFPTVAQR